MASVFDFLFLLLHRLLSILPATVYALIQALLFLLNVGLSVPVSPPLPVESVTLASLPATVFSYHPLPARPKTRTILVVHGLAVSAHKDPRITNLARAIASANPNHLVLVPYLPPLAQCNLSDNPIDHVVRIISAAKADSLFCSSGEVSVVSACISAGFSLVAASKVSVQAALCFGPHASVRNMLNHATERKGKDDSRYGINGVLASFWDPPNDPVRDMLAAYCNDDHLRFRGEPATALQPLLEAHPEAAMVFRRLHDDSGFLEQQLEEMYSRVERELTSMSPMAHIESISCKSVVLVHSKNDDIVPPSESLVLKHALNKRGCVKVSCIITTLLNHGDQEKVSLSDFLEIVQMITTMSSFFLPGSVLKHGKQKVT